MAQLNANVCLCPSSAHFCAFPFTQGVEKREISSLSKEVVALFYDVLFLSIDAKQVVIMMSTLRTLIFLVFSLVSAVLAQDIVADEDAMPISVRDPSFAERVQALIQIQNFFR